MLSSTILIVGHSHTVCVTEALQARSQHWAAPRGLRARVVNLVKFMPTLGLTISDMLLSDKLGPPQLRPEVVIEIQRHIVPGSRVYVVSMMSGNVHNHMGLMRAPIPFDFVLPNAPELPIEEGAQVIPYSAMSACLEQRLRYDRRTLEALRREFSGVILHMESPPPPSDDAHVVQWLGVMRELNTSADIVSAALRYKLWCLHSTLMKRFCHELGIIFVEAPTEACDAQGLLARQAYQDATHANAWFGSRQLRQIEAVVMLDQFESAA